MKNRRYAYRVITPLPLIESGGGIPTMTPRNTAQVNIPNMTAAPASMTPVNNTAFPSEIKQGGGFSVGSAAGIAGVAGGVLNALAMSNQGGYSNPAILPGNSTTQQTVDSVASMLPFYSLGKSVGNYAKTDYMTQNEFGELANENKFKVADTIGTFIDPLGSLVSGLSGEGWTANERAKIINEKAAPARQAFEKRKAAELKQREIDAGLGGKYWDQNQLMQAEMGGPIFDQNSTPKGMMVTAYNEGGEHSENKSGFGGVPVDQFGNKVVASNARPVATTEEGEVTFFSKRNNMSYVFSNKIFVE